MVAALTGPKTQLDEGLRAAYSSFCRSECRTVPRSTPLVRGTRISCMRSAILQCISTPGHLVSLCWNNNLNQIVFFLFMIFEATDLKRNKRVIALEWLPKSRWWVINTDCHYPYTSSKCRRGDKGNKLCKTTTLKREGLWNKPNSNPSPCK